MKLNAWLKQNPASTARLQVVERLAQALNAVHDRGEPLAALDPEHVEVDGDGDCDISPARRGNPAPGYCAPERTEGGPPSPEADIYAAGAIAWEVLSGRPYAAAPSHLAEAARDVPRELADAVMACLEQSPQWRPRDLTYIAQLAQHTLGTGSRDSGGGRSASVRSSARPASSRSAAPRSARTSSARTSGRSASPIRTTPLQEPRSHAMLAIIAGVVVVAAGAGYYWTTTHGKAAPATVTPTTVAPAALTVSAKPGQPPVMQATPRPVAVASTPPITVAPRPAPTTAAPATPVPIPATVAPTRPAPTPTPVPPPVTMARALPPPVTQPALTEVRRPTPPPVVLPPPTTTTTTTVAAAPVLPRETPVLSTVSPPSVRRPGKYVLDLRGTGLRSDLRVRIVPLKEAPHGITIVRQACKSANLVQVLIDLDTEVTPGGYAITLADSSGGQTAALTLTVTK
jgi:hypothetical protein